ncbi:DUF6801 domain-containing protein [Amycolatopsis nigrescens]|uniref:DUF6801 domain-containing protein n=1 Tax=Amycolatopsis nigrescens TaxID=381445 RepID=UPI00039C9AB5|nr:DUF6801 domain-containing protein [Amycolatopsis nigrescens]
MKPFRARGPVFTKTLVAIAGAAVLLAGGTAPAGGSTAGPVSLKLSYNCPFPLLVFQPVELTIDAALPDEVKVGQPVPPIAVHAIATAPARANDGLHLVDAATLEGTAAAAATVAYPVDKRLDITVPLTVPVTTLPATGPFDVVADGASPELSFDAPGTATITVGDFAVTLTPKKADGGPTGVGTFTSECGLLPDQNTTLGTVTISE